MRISANTSPVILSKVYRQLAVGWNLWVCVNAGVTPASNFEVAISVIFGSQVSSRLRYCKRDEVDFTIVLWQTKEDRMILYREQWDKSKDFFGIGFDMWIFELYKIMVNTGLAQTIPAP